MTTEDGLVERFMALFDAELERRFWPVNAIDEVDLPRSVEGRAAYITMRGHTSSVRGAARAAIAALNTEPARSGEPITYLRDLDGSGSLHVCAKGDPGAIAVFAEPALRKAVGAAREELATLADRQTDQRGDYLYQGHADASLVKAIKLLDAALSTEASDDL